MHVFLTLVLALIFALSPAIASHRVTGQEVALQEGEAAAVRLMQEAQSSISVGNLTQALHQAQQARQLDQKHTPALLLVAEVEARLGRVDTALETLKEAIELDTGESSAYMLSALLLRDTDRLPEAITLLDQAPRTPQTLELLALLNLSQGNSEAALLAAEEGVTLDPTIDLLFVRAMALVAVPDRAVEAGEALSKLLEDPRAEELSPVKQGQAHLELGDLLGRSDDSEQAEEHFELAAKFLPHEKEVPFRRAAYLRQRGDLAGAKVALERYQQLESEQADSLEQAREAERQLRSALGDAQSHATKNQLKEALAILDQTPEASHQDPRWRLLHGKILFSMSRAEEALTDLRAARASDPTNLEAPYIEAIVTRSLGRNAEAERSLNELLALAPEMGDAHYLLAVVLADQMKLRESIASYERAIEYGVDTPALRTGLESVRKRLASSKVQDF